MIFPLFGSSFSQSELMPNLSFGVPQSPESNHWGVTVEKLSPSSLLFSSTKTDIFGVNSYFFQIEERGAKTQISGRDMEPTNKKPKTCSPEAKSDISDDENQIGAPNDVMIIGSSNKNSASPNEEALKDAKLSYSPQFAKYMPNLIQNPSSSAGPAAQWQQSQNPMHGGNMNESKRGQPAPPIPPNTVPFWMPGHPGPWDPSSWMSQSNQSKPPMHGSEYQGPFNQFTCSQTSMPHSQVPPDPSPQTQRSIKRPLSELSLEHKKLWEDQLLHNSQLWNTVRKLHGELDEYKCRVKSLETDLEALKTILKEASNNGTAASLAEKNSKLEIHERLVSPNVPLLSSMHPVGHQKAGLFKVKSEPRQLQFEKVILKKLDNMIPILPKVDGKVDPQTAVCREMNGSSVLGSTMHSTRNNQGAPTVYNSKVSLEKSTGGSNMSFIASQQTGGTGMISSNTNHASLTCHGFVKIEQQ
ncbi:OLC1v1010570C2 [Oldenlandia corymbosa var. corymbosa]|uniref:OLC1v1010570C2 n=1 Tax=Oldenlandia corymbosa var. corymbosa TaxID=529605 RepID=A0AAV1DU35_OLDCO|nr:OLC1v1010570C2 [Oldenlandia corymbosa var. corymbosa]